MVGDFKVSETAEYISQMHPLHEGLDECVTSVLDLVGNLEPVGALSRHDPLFSESEFNCISPTTAMRADTMMIEFSQRANTPRKDKFDIAPSRTPQITKTSKTPLRKFIITDSDSDNDEALCTSITRMKIAPLEEEIEGGNRLVSGDIIRQTPLNAIIVDTSDNENEDYFYNSSLDAVTKNTPNAIVKKETAHVIVDSEDEEIDLAEDYEIELESPLVMKTPSRRVVIDDDSDDSFFECSDGDQNEFVQSPLVATTAFGRVVSDDDSDNNLLSGDENEVERLDNTLKILNSNESDLPPDLKFMATSCPSNLHKSSSVSVSRCRCLCSADEMEEYERRLFRFKKLMENQRFSDALRTLTKARSICDDDLRVWWWIAQLDLHLHM